MSSYPVRKHHRLRNYDYATPGMYFVTVCIRERLPLLGRIEGDQMRLNPAGAMVQQIWEDMPEHYSGVDIDAFVVMPNHVHGIVVLQTDESGRAVAASAGAVLSLPDVMQRFKSLTTARYRVGVKTAGWPPFPRTLWQHDYYDHIIRNEAELDKIRRYIVENPQQWALDRENPDYHR